MITFQAIDIEMPEINQRFAKEWIQEIAADYGKKIGELHYIFCSDEYLYDFNVSRMHHDFYTDIVTFPLNDCEDYLSAEFYISIDRIKPHLKLFSILIVVCLDSRNLINHIADICNLGNYLS